MKRSPTAFLAFEVFIALLITARKGEEFAIEDNRGLFYLGIDREGVLYF